MNVQGTTDLFEYLTNILFPLLEENSELRKHLKVKKQVQNNNQLDQESG